MAEAGSCSTVGVEEEKIIVALNTLVIHNHFLKLIIIEFILTVTEIFFISIPYNLKNSIMKTLNCFVIALLLSFTAWSQTVPLSEKTKRAMEQVDQQTIKSHIAYLADDKLKGRMPGTEGYAMAVDYVVDQFKKIGVAPGGDNGTYLQKLIVRRATVNNKLSKAVLVDKHGNIDSLVAGRDIFIVPGVLISEIANEAPLVFAGYGIEVPGAYSDYSGIDVTGKIVVILSGSPEHLTLPSTIRAHFANPASKMEIAAQKGAIGLIVAPASMTGRVNPVSVTTAAMNPEKAEAYGLSVAGNLTVARIPFTTLQRLFFNTGKNLEQTLTNVKGGKTSSFELPTSLRLKYSSTFTDIETHNVIGKIEGGDKKLKNEYVVHTAHLDHVGVGRPIKGDSIYNGAHDNASGVASLLEIGRIYKQMDAKPHRSVLIVMVSAEEMGLLGSAYFAANPTVPKAQIVANVNTDMPTLIAPLLSVAPLGAEHSTLVKNVDFACAELGIVRQEDPMPEEVRFIRSDQYSFVQQGIPALHVKYGTLTKDNAFDLVEFTKKWRDEHYHMPSDEITNSFDFEAARHYVQLNFLISYSIANTRERPKWNEGDFFGQRSAK
jgi:hypothetical protein